MELTPSYSTPILFKATYHTKDSDIDHREVLKSTVSELLDEINHLEDFGQLNLYKKRRYKMSFSINADISGESNEKFENTK